MRVNSEGNWAFASRDLFKAELCEHCVRLSMAVKAGLPDVVAKVEPYIEDLSQKLPIIQGNQRERIVFDEIKASLPAGDFVELDSANPDETVALMKKSVPVIAQGYFATPLGGYAWSGFADLLVLEGYQIEQAADGIIRAVQVGPAPEDPLYSPWDVKSSSKGDRKYQIQLAGYLEALEQLGLASKVPMGIVLGFNKGVVRYEVSESLEVFREALDRLTAILSLTTPSTITEGFIQEWACAKKTVCDNAYCDYPRLCKKTHFDARALELLPNMNHTHGPKLRAAGFDNISRLAACTEAPDVDGLKPEFAEKHWKAAQVMQLEFDGQKALMSKISGKPDVPEPTDQDIFFDVEWFNPVDAEREFIFMFGVVGADEDFEAFIAETTAQELKAFDQFLDYGMARLAENPNLHIYHFNNPEPLKVTMLTERYGGYRADDAAALVARMVDLLPIVKDSFVPGSGSYSIKALERYYDADSKLNRGGLVAGGADAMYQFELFRQALAAGNTAQAAEIMQVITAYNRDDCLSTKLLVDWLRSLHFETVGEKVAVA